MRQLEVLRGFCIGNGKDAKIDDLLDPHELGEARCKQLTSGANPKCRWVDVAATIGDESTGDEPEDAGPPEGDDEAPRTTAPKGNRTTAPKGTRRR
jgi:hypothetical protein